MSYKRVHSKQLNSLLQRGTITLKMYQTTVRNYWLELKYEQKKFSRLKI